MESYNPLAARAQGLQELAVRGFGANLEDVSPELQFGADIFNLPPELRILRGERIYVYGQVLTAVAAEFGYLGVANQTNSGQIVVIDRCIIMSDGAELFHFRFNNTDPTRTLDAGIISRDTRWGATGSSSHVIQGTEATTTGTNVGNIRTIANTPHVLDLDIVLAPGTNFVISCQTANIASRLLFFFRERAARPEELGPFT